MFGLCLVCWLCIFTSIKDDIYPDIWSQILYSFTSIKDDIYPDISPQILLIFTRNKIDIYPDICPQMNFLKWVLYLFACTM